MAHGRTLRRNGGKRRVLAAPLLTCRRGGQSRWIDRRTRWSRLSNIGERLSLRVEPRPCRPAKPACPASSQPTAATLSVGAQRAALGPRATPRTVGSARRGSHADPGDLVSRDSRRPRARHSLPSGTRRDRLVDRRRIDGVALSACLYRNRVRKDSYQRPSVAYGSVRKPK